MTKLSDFNSSPVFDRVILVKTTVKLEITGWDWVQDDDAYYIQFDPLRYGVLTSIYENGNSYEKVASISDCKSTQSSWYFDVSSKILYVHTSTDEAPNVVSGSSYKFCIIAFVCFGFSSTTSVSALDIGNAGFSVPVASCLSSDSVSTISTRFGDTISGAMDFSSGEIKFVNNGWFYWSFENFIWINGLVSVLVGQIGEDFSDYLVVWRGVIERVSVDDNLAVLSVVDLRSFFLSRTISNAVFDQTTYENMDPQYAGKHIPLVFGRCNNVPCILIDAENLKWKITNHKIRNVLAVYAGDLVMIEGTDYSVDLDNAEITFYSDPGDVLITADVEGIQVSEIENNYHQDREHTDSSHADAYNDISHQDSEHSDSYTDIEHADVVHSDVAHSDYHGDYYDAEHYDGV